MVRGIRFSLSSQGRAIRRSPLLVAIRRSPLLGAIQRSPLLGAIQSSPLLVAIRRSPLLVAIRRSPLLVAIGRSPLLGRTSAPGWNLRPHWGHSDDRHASSQLPRRIAPAKAGYGRWRCRRTAHQSLANIQWVLVASRVRSFHSSGERGGPGEETGALRVQVLTPIRVHGSGGCGFFGDRRGVGFGGVVLG